MIWGMTTSTFTFVHVLLSLAAIATGAIVVSGLLTGRRLDGWTLLFLVTTIATSVTGFGFPFDRLLPSHKVGIASLALLAVALLARYVFRLVGAWSPIYVIAALAALYLDVLVAIVQAFQKMPALAALAPTQTEPPFVIAQVVVLLVFVVLTVLGTKRFRRELGLAP